MLRTLLKNGPPPSFYVARRLLRKYRAVDICGPVGSDVHVRVTVGGGRPLFCIPKKNHPSAFEHCSSLENLFDFLAF